MNDDKKGTQYKVLTDEELEKEKKRLGREIVLNSVAFAGLVALEVVIYKLVGNNIVLPVLGLADLHFLNNAMRLYFKKDDVGDAKRKTLHK